MRIASPVTMLTQYDILGALTSLANNGKPEEFFVFEFQETSHFLQIKLHQSSADTYLLSLWHPNWGETGETTDQVIEQAKLLKLEFEIVNYHGSDFLVVETRSPDAATGLVMSLSENVFDEVPHHVDFSGSPSAGMRAHFDAPLTILSAATTIMISILSLLLILVFSGSYSRPDISNIGPWEAIFIVLIVLSFVVMRMVDKGKGTAMPYRKKWAFRSFIFLAMLSTTIST